MKKSSRLALLATLLAAFGCGETDQTAELDTSSRPLGATCQESDLSKPDVCEGIWEYNTNITPCYKNEQRPECGVKEYEKKTCYTYNTCRHSKFGVESYQSLYASKRVAGYNNWTVGSPGKLWLWRTWDGSSCSSMGSDNMPTKSHPSNSTVAAFCQSLAEDERSRLISTYGQDIEATSSAASNYSCTGQLSYNGGYYTTYWYRCDVGVRLPIYKLGTGSECGVKSTEQCDDTTRPIYNTCRLPAHGDDTPGACGFSETKYSAFGVTRASLNSVPNLAASQPPRCTTADNITSAQDKFTRLTATLSSAAQNNYSSLDVEKLRTLAVGKLKLLLELHGEQLTPTQRAQIRDLYVQQPGRTPACGTTWTPATAPTGGCDSATVQGTLALCDRLTQAHVPSASAAASASMCVDLRPSVPSASVCTDRTYLDKYITTVPSVLVNAFSKLETTDAQVRKSALQERLGLIQRWYSGVKTDSYTGTTFSTADFWRDVSAVTNSLELGAYANAIALVDPSVAGSSVISNAEHLRSGYAVDREILNAAFTDMPGTTTPPLTGAPVLYVLADAFRPLSTRLGEVDALHDLGCRFKTCTGGFSSHISQTHGLIAKLADRDGLTATYDTKSSLVHADWRPVFAQIINRYDAVVKAAVIDAVGEYSPAKIHEATPATPATYAFAEIVNASRSRSEHFALTGQFRSKNVDAIVVGLTQAKLNTVNNELTTALAALENARKDYSSTRTLLLNTQINFMNGQGAEQNALKQLDIKGTLVEQLTADLAGSRTAATVDKERFGSMADSYDRAIARLENTWGGQYLTRSTFGPFNLSPANVDVVKWTGGAITDISAISASGPYALSNGDLVRITATGSWSPTCAMQKGANSVTPPLQVPMGAQATSQGYYAQYSGSHYDAVGYTKEHFENWSRGHTLCAGGQLGVSTKGGLASLTGSAQYCWSETEGGSKKDSVSNGTEYRNSASFNAGLRMANTPFPQYPVGSLLAVRMKRGEKNPSQIIDVEVVQAPETMLLVSQPRDMASGTAVESDLYLIANELRDATCDRTNPGSLSVKLLRLQPKASFAKHLQTAMAKTYAKFQKTLAETILPQGTLLPSQIQALETEAMSNLLFECTQDMPCDLSSYDPDLMQLYRTWVMHSIAQADRQLMMNKLEQQLQVAAQEWEAMAADLVTRKRTTQLSAILPAWTIRNLDLDYMREKTRNVADMVNTRVYPFIKVKYPEALYGKPGVIEGLLNNTSAQSQFTALTSDLDWTSEWVDLAGRIKTVAETIQAELTNTHTAVIKDTERNGVTVAVAFKKPRALISTGLEEQIPGESWFDTHYNTLYREASEQRAERVWAALEANLPVQFELLPEDLYQFARLKDSKGDNLPVYELQMLCSHTVPVIRGMGVVIANDGDPTNDTLNNYGRIIQTTAGPNLTYVGANSSENVRMNNNAWLSMGLPISYARIDQVNQVFWSQPAGTAQLPPSQRGAGEGLSPVGSYTINGGFVSWLDPIQQQYQRATAFVVMLNLEFRDKGDSPAWVSNCKL